MDFITIKYSITNESIHLKILYVSGSFTSTYIIKIKNNSNIQLVYFKFPLRNLWTTYGFNIMIIICYFIYLNLYTSISQWKVELEFRVAGTFWSWIFYYSYYSDPDPIQFYGSKKFVPQLSNFYLNTIELQCPLLIFLRQKQSRFSEEYKPNFMKAHSFYHFNILISCCFKYIKF